jgi:hypothetical protein
LAFLDALRRILRGQKSNHSIEPEATGQQVRPLSNEERALIMWLLLHGDPSARQFLPQLDRTLARGNCACGCPSIDLIVSEPTSTPGVEPIILVDFVGTVGGKNVGVVLRQTGGCLSELEVYGLTGNPNQFCLPDLSTLRPWSAPSPPPDSTMQIAIEPQLYSLTH